VYRTDGNHASGQPGLAPRRRAFQLRHRVGELGEQGARAAALDRLGGLASNSDWSCGASVSRAASFFIMTSLLVANTGRSVRRQVAWY